MCVCGCVCVGGACVRVGCVCVCEGVRYRLSRNNQVCEVTLKYNVLSTSLFSYRMSLC